eukprot:EG_transcript_20709
MERAVHVPPSACNPPHELPSAPFIFSFTRRPKPPTVPAVGVESDVPATLGCGVAGAPPSNISALTSSHVSNRSARAELRRGRRWSFTRLSTLTIGRQGQAKKN